MKLKITKIFESYFDAYVEADSLEEALEKFKNDELDFEEDIDAYNCTKTIWAQLDEDDEIIDGGEITE